MSFEIAQKIADAVLYEGYVLYPYRASAVKNQVRWQFGVVVPRAYSESGGDEPWAMQTECLIAPSNGVPRIDLKIRFLQLQSRTVEQNDHGVFRKVDALDVDGKRLVSWDEGVEREVSQSAIPLSQILAGELVVPIEAPAGREVEIVRADARVVLERWTIAGCVRVVAEALGDLVKIRIRIENASSWAEGGDRDTALRQSLLGAHTLVAVRDGDFVSLLDPPESAKEAAASCSNLHTWPVLVGPDGSRDMILSSPIILYDYPAVAPESPGDLCDATEIDEILTLRVMTLTDNEKREARSTDERARRIVDRSDSMPPEMLDKLHGAIRYLRVGQPILAAQPGEESWETFLNPPGAPRPEDAWVQVGPERACKGSRVRLRPCRRADSMDLFLNGRTARIESVYRDLEDRTYVAVVLDDDPASDLHSWYGRFYYFYPEEIELLHSEGGD